VLELNISGQHRRALPRLAPVGAESAWAAFKKLNSINGGRSSGTIAMVERSTIFRGTRRRDVKIGFVLHKTYLVRETRQAMNISQTEIASLVSQTGDEYLALLLVPDGDFNRIMVGRGIGEIEAHEQLINELMDLNANPSCTSGSAKSEHLL
jgi:hypothetical protein